MSVLVDTNIVLRLKGSGHPEARVVAGALARLAAGGEQVCVSAQSLTESWAVLTRPKSANGAGLSPAQARAALDQILGAFPLLPDPPNLFTTWLDLCTTHEVRGRQTYDARLVAFMVAGGINRLVSLNPTDFARYEMIHIINPAHAA